LAQEWADRLPVVLIGSVAVLGDAAAAQDNRTLVAAEAERLLRVREQTRDAERAMRFNPLRSKNRAQVADLAARLRTVARAGPYADLLAVEAAVLSARDGHSPALRKARAELPAVVEATARVVDGLLAGRDSAEDAAAARRLLERYRIEDPQAVAVALRRPFHRVLDLCVPPSPPSAVAEDRSRRGSADTRDDDPEKT
jgi:hypothetical protein